MKNIFKNSIVKRLGLLLLLLAFALPLQSCIVHERTHTTTYKKAPHGHYKKKHNDRGYRNYSSNKKKHYKKKAKENKHSKHRHHKGRR